MTPPFSVTNALDAYVEAQDKRREPDGKWHPSSLYGCTRQAIYEHRGTEPSDPREARSKRTMRVGQIMHEFVQTAVREYPGVMAAWTEVKVAIPELNIEGSVDQLLMFEGVDSDGPTYEAEEFKSINSRAYKYGDLPKPDHLGQFTAYIIALRLHGGVADDGAVIPPLGCLLDRGRITYVSKDDLLIGEYPVFYSPVKEKELRDRVAYLNGYAAEPWDLPPRLPLEQTKKGEKRNWRCGYCVFQTKCWEVDPE